MRAYLISSTFMREGASEFLRHREQPWIEERVATGPERVVEFAGRVCYMSFGKKQHRKNNIEYIRNLMEMGHDSVLEHANFTILADKISRSLTHQLVRHRIGFAYSQLSQQYHDESDAEFIEPALLDSNTELKADWENLIKHTRKVYQSLLKVGKGTAGEEITNKERTRLYRSFARSVLPNATATTLVTTGNARAWRHLLEVRGSVIGDLEMREYCVAIFNILSNEAPNLFSDFELLEDTLGKAVVKMATNK